MKTTLLLCSFIFGFVQVFAQSTINERTGLIFGVSAGIGSASFYGNTDAVSGGADLSLPNLKIGYMLSSKLAILVANPGISFEKDAKDRSFDGFLPSVQYWIKPNLWLSAGFGLGMESPAIYEKQKNHYFGTACQFSTGFELYKRNSFVIDLQGTLFAGAVDTGNQNREMVSFLTGIGFNFY